MAGSLMNKKPIRTLDALTHHGLIKQTDLPVLQDVVEEFSLAITDQMHQLMDKTNADDPIARQFVPSVEELKSSDAESIDPIGDALHTTVKGIVHRYPDRCLMTPVHVCPVYCRFCFRREKVGKVSETMTPQELEAAYAYIEKHTEIGEVILTGGDPLILKPAALKRILERLSAISHIDVLRLHTRVPVVESRRINADMVAALQCGKPVYVLLHANHPDEFTQEAVQACAALVDAGIPMLSQTVLLKGINDKIEVLSTLMRCFVRNRIKPYYLHHGDLARGTEHFRTTIEEGQRLMRELRGRFSGLCQPTYMLDIPGGHGKVPIGPCYLYAEENTGDSDQHYRVEDYRGCMHDY